MMYELPTSLDIGGRAYAIRSDYRAVLDICAALSDPDLDEQEKAYVALGILYPDFEEMPSSHYQDALNKCFWFLNCGNEEKNTQKTPKLVDWEQDFQYIVAPINRVLGTEVRAIPYDFKKNTGGFHWWSFISAYYEIGDCTFAQIVRIRDKKAKGKKLDKSEQEWYRQNRHMVDMKTTLTEYEKEIFKEWGV